MFIAEKKIKGRKYYYIVKRYRKNGKVKSKTICYIPKYDGHCPVCKKKIKEMEQ